MDALRIVEALGLKVHPEGGWYRETFRHQKADTARGDLTAIYFLLEGGQGSAWHRVTDADEVWCYHAGASLKLTIQLGDEPARDVVLGPNLMDGDHPQSVVPRGAWQRADSQGEWTLVSCVVAPAFTFDSFQMRELTGD